MIILIKFPNFVHQLFKISNISLPKGGFCRYCVLFFEQSKDKSMNLLLPSHLQTTLGCSDHKEQLTTIQPFDFDYLMYNKLRV